MFSVTQLCTPFLLNIEVLYNKTFTPTEDIERNFKKTEHTVYVKSTRRNRKNLKIKLGHGTKHIKALNQYMMDPIRIQSVRSRI